MYFNHNLNKLKSQPPRVSRCSQNTVWLQRLLIVQGSQCFQLQIGALRWRLPQLYFKSSCHVSVSRCSYETVLAIVLLWGKEQSRKPAPCLGARSRGIHWVQEDTQPDAAQWASQPACSVGPCPTLPALCPAKGFRTVRATLEALSSPAAADYSGHLRRASKSVFCSILVLSDYICFTKGRVKAESKICVVQNVWDCFPPLNGTWGLILLFLPWSSVDPLACR